MTRPDSASEKRPRVSAITPLLLVTQIQRSLDFYAALGFVEPKVHGEPPCFAMMNRDGFDLMLSVAESDRRAVPLGNGAAWSMYIVVADLAAEMEALRAANITIDEGPRDTFYEMREIDVVDPDGHRICLAQNTLGASFESSERWEGVLDVGDTRLRLAFTLGIHDQHWVGSLDSLDQGALNLPLDSVRRDGSTLAFEMKRIQASFSGTFDAGRTECAGLWTQGGRTWALVFRRG